MGASTRAGIHDEPIAELRAVTMKIYKHANRQLLACRREQPGITAAPARDVMAIPLHGDLIEICETYEAFLDHPTQQYPKPNEVRSGGRCSLRKPGGEGTRTDQRDEAARTFQEACIGVIGKSIAAAERKVSARIQAAPPRARSWARAPNEYPSTLSYGGTSLVSVRRDL
jgi:hypothetical protein